MPVVVIVILLSLVQGISEFLPVSSAAHLLLIERFLNFKLGGLDFDLALNLGTLFTIIVYFRKEITILVKEGFKLFTFKSANYRNNLLIKWIVATLPILVVGFLFVHFGIEKLVRSPRVLGICLIVFGISLYAVDKKFPELSTYNKLTYKNAFVIGLFQCLALIPGVSRSGITITAARIQNLTRKDAVTFSFLIAIPSTLGAVILGAKGFIFLLGNLVVSKLPIPTSPIQTLNPAYIHFLPLMAVGVVLSFFFGLIFVNWLLKFLQRHDFKIFMIYRIILGLIVIIISLS